MLSFVSKTELGIRCVEPAIERSLLLQFFTTNDWQRTSFENDPFESMRIDSNEGFDASSRIFGMFRFQMKVWMRIGIVLLAGLAIAGCSETDKKAVKALESKDARAAMKGDKGDGKASKAKPEAERPKRTRPAVPVKVAIVGEGDITSSLVFDSVLETESSVEIFAESSGVILEVLAEEGDRVSMGQVLARLEDDTQRVDAEEAKARYDHEKLNFQRRIDLYERQLINQQEFETAKFNLEQNRLRFERAKIQLENTVVRATVDGVITERLAQVGKRVTANRQLFSMMNLDELHANVNVPGQHLLNVKQGLEAVIDSDLIEGVQYEAFVKLVSPVVDPGSGTFKAKVAVVKDNGMPIYPGMFVNVRIIVDNREDSILIPKDAVVHEGDLKYIYTVHGGKARKQLLQEGYSNVEFVQSTSGVNKGDAVIIMGHNALKDGANVKIVADAVAAENLDSTPSAAAEG